MKRIKKFASFLLAMLMVLAMTMTAFAAEDSVPVDDAGGVSEYEITINYDVAGYEYQAYQIFKGDLAIIDGKKTLSNIEWGSGVDKTKVNTLLRAKGYVKTEKDGEGNDVERPFSAREVAEEILNGQERDSEVAKQFAADIAGCLSGVSASSTEVKTGDKVTGYKISGLEAGYYLVQNSTVPEDGAYTRYMLEVVGDVPVSPKTGVPTSEKKIVEGEDRVDVNEASIGDTITYEITGTLPSNYADYKEYYYVFTDTLSKGLTYNDDVKVEVKNDDNVTTVTDLFYRGKTENSDGTTTIKVGIQNLKWLEDVTSSSVIIVTYTARLNEDAVIAGEGNPNEVVLEYFNNPNKSGDGKTEPGDGEPKTEHPTGVTPKDEVVTYTTEFAILKTNEAKEVLAGAEFTLTGNGVKVSLVTKETFEEDANGAYWKLKNGSYTMTAPILEDTETVKNNKDDYESTDIKYSMKKRTVLQGTPTTEGEASATDTNKAVAVVGNDGRITFTGLGAGEYTLTETVTPEGYNTYDPITFTISFTQNEEGKWEFSTNRQDTISLGSNNTLQATIVNQRGSLLPSTGGIGTTIFYVVGSILVIGAGILLVAKKRMSANK